MVSCHLIRVGIVRPLKIDLWQAVDQGCVAVFKSDRRSVPPESGDVASPADNPNDDDNVSDTESVDFLEGPRSLHPTPQ